MKELCWDPEKSEWLKRERGVSFDQLVDARFITTEQSRAKPHQQLMIFEFRRYAWVVPYVEGKEYYFLKTAFPSRKHTKKYLKEVQSEENQAGL